MKRAILITAALLLTACGFELRDSADLPATMQKTHVDAPGSAGALARELDRLLRGSQVEITGPAQATAVLKIESEQMRRQVQSVGSTARAREFALEYSVSFRLLGPAGEELRPLQSLQLRRDFTFDENQVLGTTREEELIAEELRRSMAGQILRALEVR
ncbi:MAG: LPS assembly lipoprotein LptE [Xanthomonadales bacterium]|nr:LPS assembly lipoprotein LptE [Xanthomonadales bacterium]